MKIKIMTCHLDIIFFNFYYIIFMYIFFLIYNYIRNSLKKYNYMEFSMERERERLGFQVRISLYFVLKHFNKLFIYKSTLYNKYVYIKVIIGPSASNQNKRKFGKKSGTHKACEGKWWLKTKTPLSTPFQAVPLVLFVLDF